MKQNTQSGTYLRKTSFANLAFSVSPVVAAGEGVALETGAGVAFETGAGVGVGSTGV